MNDSFAPAASGPAPSKGTIFSDCECTIVGLKDGTKFYAEYAIYLAAMKHSGYDVIFHSGDVTTNEGLLTMELGKINIDPATFEYDGYLVLSKEAETAGMTGLVAFDDNHGSHGVKATYKLDTNSPSVKAVINRVAHEFEASGRTKTFAFNPQDFAKPDVTARAEPAAAFF